MKVDAIFFDKDGTLIDFDAFWVSVSVKALSEVLSRFNLQNVPLDELFEALGVHNGVTDTDGVLCKGTYAQMGQVVYDVLRRYDDGIDSKRVTDAVIDAYNKSSDSGDVKPTCNEPSAVLNELKKRNKKLVVITTDNETITRKCLDNLGITQCFDAIYTDDGRTPAKPDPYCAIDFCKRFGVKIENAIMVGDTMTDVEFAKNAGISVVILARNEKNREFLAPHATVVIQDLAQLLDVLE